MIVGYLREAIATDDPAVIRLAFNTVRGVLTMPPRSEAQRRAMRAAAAGHSTLGIPKKVGKKFSRSDPGGKLPKRKSKPRHK
jgi:hypothetical protein